MSTNINIAELEGIDKDELRNRSISIEDPNQEDGMIELGNDGQKLDRQPVKKRSVPKFLGKKNSN